MNFYDTLEYGSALMVCIRRSLEFGMQHDHIPKKLNFGLSSTPYGLGPKSQMLSSVAPPGRKTWLLLSVRDMSWGL